MTMMIGCAQTAEWIKLESTRSTDTLH